MLLRSVCSSFTDCSSLPLDSDVVKIGVATVAVFDTEEVSSSVVSSSASSVLRRDDEPPLLLDEASVTLISAQRTTCSFLRLSFTIPRSMYVPGVSKVCENSSSSPVMSLVHLKVYVSSEVSMSTVMSISSLVVMVVSDTEQVASRK